MLLLLLQTLMVYSNYMHLLSIRILLLCKWSLVSYFF